MKKFTPEQTANELLAFAKNLKDSRTPLLPEFCQKYWDKHFGLLAQDSPLLKKMP